MPSHVLVQEGDRLRLVPLQTLPLREKWHRGLCTDPPRLGASLHSQHKPHMQKSSRVQEAFLSSLPSSLTTGGHLPATGLCSCHALPQVALPRAHCTSFLPTI